MAETLCETLCASSVATTVTWKRLWVTPTNVTLVPRQEVTNVKKGQEADPLAVVFPIPGSIGWDWKAYFTNYLTMLAWETVGAVGLSPHVLRVYGLKAFAFPEDVLVKADYFRRNTTAATVLLDCFSREKDSTYENLCRSGLPLSDINVYLHVNGTRLLKDGQCTATSRDLLFFDPCCGAVLPNLITENPKGLDWKRYPPNYNDDSKCWMGAVFLSIGFVHDVTCVRGRVICLDKDKGRKKVKSVPASSASVSRVYATGAGAEVVEKAVVYEDEEAVDDEESGTDEDTVDGEEEVDEDKDEEAGTDEDADKDKDEEAGTDEDKHEEAGTDEDKHEEADTDEDKHEEAGTDVPLVSGDIPNKLFTETCSCADVRSYTAGQIRTLAELLVHAVYEEQTSPKRTTYYDLVRHTLFQVLYTHRLLSVHVRHNDLLPHNVLLSNWSSYDPCCASSYDPTVAYYINNDRIWYCFKTAVRAVLSGYEQALPVSVIDRQIQISHCEAADVEQDERGDINRLVNGCLLIVQSSYDKSGYTSRGIGSRLTAFLTHLQTSCLRGTPIRETFDDLRIPQDASNVAPAADYYAGIPYFHTTPLPNSYAHCGPKGPGVPYWYLRAAASSNA